MGSTPTMTRRRALASVAASVSAGASVGVSGCLGRAKNVAGRTQPSRVQLRITTRPTDSDPHAIRIARHLADHLEAVGIAPRIRTVDDAGLYREVLINHDFDVYVGQFPHVEPIDPDALHPLLHSSFTAEPGWQNPFGLTDPNLDTLLERQRETDGEDRRDAVDDLQRELARQHPFTVVAFPDALTAVGGDRFVGWDRARTVTPGGILLLSAAEGGENGEIERNGDGTDDPDETVLRLVSTDARITTNLNPIAPEYRRHGTFTGLVYDPLIRRIDGTDHRWMARSVDRTGDRTIRVTLREGRWHDGQDLTAADVAFTYEFLDDTSLGTAETPIPSSRFRGRSTLVESVSVVDSETADIRFSTGVDSLQRRALTVPILPEHVWESRTDVVEIPGGIEIDGMTTAAQVWETSEPIGSGPLRVRSAEADERIVFERNPDHPIGTTPEAFPERLRGKPAFDALELRVVPSDVAAVTQVGDGLADATTSTLGPDAVPRIGRNANARLVGQRSGAFYHVGYNTRSEPLSNPYFRRTVGRLIDAAALVESAFNGYARPAASPLALSPSWLLAEHRWADGDPVTPFVGSDGDLDVEAAMEAFSEIGYHYDDDGALLVRDP
ncbi:ABC transporter substrate-binding protein [Halopenitus sp. POP-27]|uniref:ABC transporter substrate-binding protein n=1 Tax=Halopenitus sp. POP-27 TaxID=2994425 RepID=UPI002469380B|nr:ABC transporter substrate-binding protein [Halopenitus sp. POP-27]